MKWIPTQFDFIYTICVKSEMWKHASSLNFASVEEVRQLSCCSLAFSSCHSKVYHGPMFASSFIESAGRDRKLLRASSFTALNLLFSRCTTRNFLNVDQTVWAQHTGLIFSDFEKFSVPQGREVWLSPFWRCAAVGEEVDLFGGAPHKGFLLDFKFRPGNFPIC